MSSKIPWCDETINPVVGCSKISEGCQNCYAEKMAARLAAMGKGQYRSVISSSRQWKGMTAYAPADLAKPFAWKAPRTIFVCSMGDLFHRTVPFMAIDQVMNMVLQSPQHTFIVLTKRAGWMHEYFAYNSRCKVLPNLVLGVSVENQQAADQRIPFLLATPAAKRFVSLEPMVGSVDLTRLVIQPSDAPERGKPDVAIDCLKGWHGGANHPDPTRLDGVILGGESGSGARPLFQNWVRTIRDQCAASGIPFMFKQQSSYKALEEKQSQDGFPLLDGRIHTELAWAVRK